MAREEKDPYCCLADKMRASTEGFDAGVLISYKSIRYMVRSLSKEEVLEVLEELIVEQQQRVSPST